MATFAKSLRAHPPAKAAPTSHRSLASKSISGLVPQLKSKSLPVLDPTTVAAATPPLPPPPPPPPLLQAAGLETFGAHLQELCPEDKARVARLIQQLVHVGNEHEVNVLVRIEAAPSSRPNTCPCRRKRWRNGARRGALWKPDWSAYGSKIKIW